MEKLWKTCGKDQGLEFSTGFPQLFHRVPVEKVIKVPLICGKTDQGSCGKSDPSQALKKFSTTFSTGFPQEAKNTKVWFFLE